MEVGHVAGTQTQLLGAGFCHPRACPDTQTAIGLQPAALASHNIAGPQLGLVVVGVHRAGGCSPPPQLPPPCPFPPLNRPLCWGSSLSLNFPYVFLGLGSCCSFCLESLSSHFHLVKSLFFKPCFNVVLTSLPSPVRINCSLLCVAQQHLSQ